MQRQGSECKKNVTVIKHPDYDDRVANRKKQKPETKTPGKSKLRRLKRKCNPEIGWGFVDSLKPATKLEATPDDGVSQLQTW